MSEFPTYPPGTPLTAMEAFWHYKGWIPATKLGAWKRGQDGGSA